MKKDTFLKILYVCLAVIVIVFTMSYVYYSIESKINNVYADTLEDNAILNFNQYFNGGSNYSVVSTTTSRTNIYNQTSFNVEKGHYYYIGNSASNDIVALSLVRYNNGIYVNYNDYFTNSIAYNNSNYNQIAIQINTVGIINGKFNFIVVDLTQMFGVGNEPTTIEEAKNYFPLDYYNYTLGSPISISQLNFENGYNLGYKNGLDIGYKYTNSEIVFKNQINNFENLNTHNKVNAIINEDNTITYYSNNIGTGYLIPKNKQVIITWEFISAGSIMSLDNGEGSHFELDIDNNNNINSRYVYSFSSSEDASLNIFNEEQENITINNLIVYIANDEQISYDNGYDDGWKDGKNSVDTQSYYDNGFRDGKNWQINHNPNTAWGSSWEFIGSAFSGVGDILSIEIMPNIPLWTFIAIPLLFGLIAVIYKLIGD